MFPLPLLIQPRVSVIAGRLRVVLHLLALAALLHAGLPRAAHLAGALSLAASLVLGWRRPPPPRLRCGANGQLDIRRAETWQAASVLPGSVALPWLIVLRWRENDRRHSLVLPMDALSARMHRRLRVWLRWKSGAPAPALR